ncbi:rhamnosyltransferase WsaF family glycosyltransferase [Bradyrhizobium sp. USDA 4353]
MALVKMFAQVRAWWRYARQWGYTNATIYGLYKLSPKRFGLLKAAVQRQSAVELMVMHQAQVAQRAEPKAEPTFPSIYDFKPWTEFGGVEHPRRHYGDRCIIWFVPDWLNVWGGGHYTLFRFANHLAQDDTRCVIFVYDNHRHTTPHALQRELDAALPNCKIEVVVDPKLLPECAAAIATTWQSAYSVRAFPFAKSKFYFMQDYESFFYAFGSASMQANATYGFGFYGITGGGWLKSRYESHGGSAIAYRFAADRKIFFPRREDGQVNQQVRRLFFYGRPSTERRCYELGMASLYLISKKYPDLEIVIAGLDLQSPPPFKATLEGNMSLKETGDLYRTCDIGMAFSATNLSYLPVELMASGVPVISNNGPHVEWHCHHGVNSWLVDPVPQAVLEGFDRLYESRELRQKLVDGGLETMASLSWEDQMTRVGDHIKRLMMEQSTALERDRDDASSTR